MGSALHSELMTEESDLLARSVKKFKHRSDGELISSMIPPGDTWRCSSQDALTKVREQSFFIYSGDDEWDMQMDGDRMLDDEFEFDMAMLHRGLYH